MSLDTRLNKLMPVLTARERAILILRSMKDKTPESPSWRRTMPREQSEQFNRYIGLIRTCNGKLAFFITALEKEVEKLVLRFSWWFCLKSWQLNLVEIDYAASIVARHAITESEYRSLADELSLAYVPVAQAAEEVVAYERAWSDADLRPLGPWPDELVLTDAAHVRLRGEAEARLRTAASTGAVDTKGRGAALRVRSGSLDAWLGRAPTVMPEWAGGYDVRPDDRAASVAADLTTLKNLRQSIDQAPFQRRDAGISLSSTIAELEEAMMVSIAVRWLEILETEIVVDEVAGDFGGEDPLKPILRTALETSKQSLKHLHEALEAFGKVLVLPEVRPEGLEEMRLFVRTED